MVNNILSMNNSLMLDSVVSPDSGWSTFLDSMLNSLLQIPLYIIESLIKLIYAITKLVLVLIDYAFVFVRFLIGINTDFSSLQNLEETDLLFRFLGSDAVMGVVKSMFIIGIVLIILFCVIAIVKNEYAAATTGAPNSKKQVMVSTLKSLFLMILTPLIVFGSLFISSAILKSVDMATTASNTPVSMGTQVFLASSYQANAYRSYANANLKIPITYNFSETKVDENIDDWAKEGGVSDLQSAYIGFRNSSVWNRGLTTYTMFLNRTFTQMTSIDTADRLAFENHDTNGSDYHLTYDEGIYTLREEYFVMGELVDYLMKSGENVYFKTPQDIISSWNNANESTEYMNIFMQEFESGRQVAVNFSVKYNEYAETINYSSKTLSGIQDEAKGSVFLVCTRKTDNEGKSYFAPLRNGKDGYDLGYSEVGSVIVARGLFDEGNPTAIREDGNNIEFYRDKLNVPYLIDLFPKISYELPEGTTEDVGMKLIKEGVKLISGVDLNQYLPYVYYNFDIWHLFSKITRTVGTLQGGEFFLNYNFDSDGTMFSHFYNYRELNVLVLVMVSVVLLNLLLRSVLGVAARIFDIVLIFITYPAVCATIPLDEGSRYQNWTKQLVGSVLSIFGIIVGINLVLMLYPIIDSINIFTASDFQRAVNLGIIPESWSAAFANFLIKMMMTFAAFSIIELAAAMLSKLIGVDIGVDPKNDKHPGKLGDDADKNILYRGRQAMEATEAVVKTTGKIISGQILVDFGKNIKDTVVGFIPGNAVVSEAADAIKFRKKQSEMANSRVDLQNTLKRAAPGNNVDKAIKAQTKRTNDITKKNTYKPKK